jgi:starch-binding outer membrane protein, SusD/RagB family
MKKLLLVNISLAMLAVGGMTSCSDILDKEVDLTYTEDNIYGNYDRTRGVLANAYTYLPDAFVGYTNGQFLAASRDCMTDNALSYWNVHYYHSVLNDSYDAKNHWFASTYWTNDLKGIRVCNDFLSKVREDVIGNAQKSGDDNKLCDRYKAEARFIRAILHFDLIGYFGAVPIEDHVLDNSEAASITRTPSAEALKWVADECDAIIQSGALPFRYSNENENWGRINGAAVYALKSRALLYRASALNNPTNEVVADTDALQIVAPITIGKPVVLGIV